ncbi:DNA (cytosine-5-)-methyltransferase [Serinibacter arcticus]|uniref:DNA (cytosine-5-)-methyltransferase n=1 Tax=Serinibacter arcticus TaxID=1655435 RepID=UPI0013052E24|nr:DNA (cytosine-5-)-methyltransferase [Serinibacter arcticus]
MDSSFTFVDLFAGVGGFHAALSGLGGRCVYVAEKDRHARDVYTKAWIPEGDLGVHVTEDINDDVPLDAGHSIQDLLERANAGKIALANIPEDFDVLTAGFPCQAFSKSGKQEGILDAVRGTLFHNILVIVAMRRPKIVFLENVKNLVGPLHRETTFATIVRSLSDLGYAVNPEPTIFSPHQIPPEQGGGPQNRERVYILAVRRDLTPTTSPFDRPKNSTWSPETWAIATTPLVDLDGIPAVVTREWIDSIRPNDETLAESAENLVARYLGSQTEYRLSGSDTWFDAYQLLIANVVSTRKRSIRGAWFPGHPIWFDVADKKWLARERADAAKHRHGGEHVREWKDQFLDRSLAFVENYAAQLVGPESGDTLRTILNLPNNAWRKLEWQAKDARSLDACLIQLRPSGVRVKKANYAPALVAINQAPILGSERRRITPYEAGRLQGFPDRVYEAMLKTGQPTGQSYKQFGNAVHVGTVRFAFVHFVCHHFEDTQADRLGGLGRLIERCKEIRSRWEGVAAPPARSTEISAHAALAERE